MQVVFSEYLGRVSFLDYDSGYFDLDCGVRHMGVCDDAINRIALATMCRNTFASKRSYRIVFSTVGAS